MTKAADILEIPATITERGQTTVPAAIRRMLALDKRDRVVFRGLADGTVVIARKRDDETAADPVIARFLSFLAQDMTSDPGRIRPVSNDVVARARTLVSEVSVDLDAALADDDA